jgi:hypothetical protein
VWQDVDGVSVIWSRQRQPVFKTKLESAPRKANGFGIRARLAADDAQAQIGQSGSFSIARTGGAAPGITTGTSRCAAVCGNIGWVMSSGAT